MTVFDFIPLECWQFDSYGRHHTFSPDPIAQALLTVNWKQKHWLLEPTGVRKRQEARHSLLQPISADCFAVLFHWPLKTPASEFFSTGCWFYLGFRSRLSFVFSGEAQSLHRASLIWHHSPSNNNESVLMQPSLDYWALGVHCPILGDPSDTLAHSAKLLAAMDKIFTAVLPKHWFQRQCRRTTLIPFQ